jgi:hypothetical protein
LDHRDGPSRDPRETEEATADDGHDHKAKLRALAAAQGKPPSFNQPSDMERAIGAKIGLSKTTRRPCGWSRSSQTGEQLLMLEQARTRERSRAFTTVSNNLMMTNASGPATGPYMGPMFSNGGSGDDSGDELPAQPAFSSTAETWATRMMREVVTAITPREPREVVDTEAIVRSIIAAKAAGLHELAEKLERTLDRGPAALPAIVATTPAVAPTPNPPRVRRKART